MSLIEKAVGKLSQMGKTAPEPAGQQSLVELAVSRREEPRIAEPAPEPTAAPNEPTLPASAEPAKSESQRQNINLGKLRQAGMITPDGERSLIAEEFRLIKRPLIMNALGQGAAPITNGNLIMVTSSFPREGKSFCSINLAMSIAMEMDNTVLLVDADVAKPSIPQFLGLKAEKGLMDVLLDEHLDLSDVLIKTNVEKLTVLPAGRGYQYSTELLASEAMYRLLQEMAQRYSDRIIIFDSPPLLATTESRVLATHMGQIVMVVEAGKTRQEALKEALHYLESCDVVSLLMNKGSGTGGTDYYGYGGYGSYGGYGYGSYGR